MSFRFGNEKRRELFVKTLLCFEFIIGFLYSFFLHTTAVCAAAHLLVSSKEFRLRTTDVQQLIVIWSKQSITFTKFAKCTAHEISRSSKQPTTTAVTPEATPKKTTTTLHWKRKKWQTILTQLINGYVVDLLLIDRVAFLFFIIFFLVVVQNWLSKQSKKEREEKQWVNWYN